jgi:curli biogenesis system outer membrane secretion channel CsgG
MNKYLGALIVISAILLNSCATQSTSIKSGYNFTKIKRIAVLDFTDAFNQPLSGTMASEVFIKYMLKAGYDVVERNELDKILKEKNISASGLTDRKNIKKLLGIDALVAGSVEAFIPETDTYEGGYPRFVAAQVGIAARIVDVETGETVWSGSGSYDGMNSQIAAEYLVSSLVRQMMSDFASEEEK